MQHQHEVLNIIYLNAWNMKLVPLYPAPWHCTVNKNCEMHIHKSWMITARFHVGTSLLKTQHHDGLEAMVFAVVFQVRQMMFWKWNWYLSHFQFIWRNVKLIQKQKFRFIKVANPLHIIQFIEPTEIPTMASNHFWNEFRKHNLKLDSFS